MSKQFGGALIVVVSTALLIASPAIAAGLVPCGTSTTHAECTFDDLVTLVKNIINFIIFVAAPVAAIMFTYAGFLYLTAAGDTGQIKRAHGIFWTVFVGFVIVLSAWLIVKSVSVLVTPDFRGTG